MICYLATGAHTYTIRSYLESWGAGIASRVRVVSYESMARDAAIPGAATYIFSDIERLTFGRQAIALQLWDRLRAETPARLLNHPTRTHRRLALLKHLHASGINEFRAQGCRDRLYDLNFPVFVRLTNDHYGSRTDLLTSPEEVRRAVRTLRLQGWPASELLITEFCDTADADGVYRKYSAFIVDGRIIPRHLIFGRSWMLKNPEISDDGLAEEQRRYVEANPHEAELRRICRDANVDYGRIDYGLLDGRVQVWEINTNPYILQQPSTYKERNIETHRLFARRIEEAFESLAGDQEARMLDMDLGWGIVATRVTEKVAEVVSRCKRAFLGRLFSARSRFVQG